MIDKILAYDKALFRILNNKWHNGFMDTLAPFLRNAPTWAPLYLFMVLMVAINFKKTGWIWCLFFGATAGISDIIASRFLKVYIVRLRPCNDPDMADGLRVLVAYRPQSSSFVSAHSFSHFAMATFFYITLRQYVGKWMAVAFLWAFLVAYSQVYVGVHFPLDIACGGLIGILVGYLSGKLFNKKFGLA